MNIRDIEKIGEQDGFAKVVFGRPIGYITIVSFFTEEIALKLGPLAADAVRIISKETGHMILWQRANNRR